MNIEEFRSRLGAGGARPNQFRVTLNFPTIAESDNTYSILVSGAAIPASTVNPAIIQYRGREIKLAGERIFDPWTVTIINDTNQSLRRPFEQWLDSMNQKDDNRGNLNPVDYFQDIEIEHLDRNDAVLPGGKYILYDAFPINMSEIALQYAQNDIIEEFTVTFQYQRYENVGVDVSV
jgi:hypothetical protein|tara:strand:- start:9552 stop:10082 length:531 start_codon:yes stop_codon:yes gene_type:complete